MKLLTKPTNLILSSLSLPVVVTCNDNYQSRSVQTTKNNSTVKEEKFTSWKDELLKRSGIAYVSRNDSTGIFLPAKTNGSLLIPIRISQIFLIKNLKLCQQNSPPFFLFL
jgi:hypothetical protein